LSARESKYRDTRRKCIVLFSAVFILVLALSVLILHSPPGMETGAALLLVTPFIVGWTQESCPPR
jgi:hypothetical protein